MTSLASLGMIEVRGFLGAVVAADAALKAANVSLEDVSITRGGLATVLITGDVAAVTAGVDAGVTSIESFECLLSSHVIARTDRQTTTLIPNPRLNQKKLPIVSAKTEKLVVSSEEPQPRASTDASQKELPDTKVAKEQISDTTAPEPDQRSKAIKPTANPKTWVTEKEQLEKMRVVDLRTQAYRMNLTTLTKKQIKMGNKKTLVDAIIKDLQRRNDS